MSEAARTGAPIAEEVKASASEDVLDVMARQHAIKMLAARALSISAVAENIPSPCLSVCQMNRVKSLCEGCFRTMDEIRDWSKSNDAAKRGVWARIIERLRQTYPEL